MHPNPLTELINRLGLTKRQFADLVGKSQPTIEKHTSRIPPDFAEELAEISANSGYRDLAREFEAMAKEEDAASFAASDTVTFERATPAELDLLLGLLEIVRNPDPRSTIDRSLPEIIRERMGLRRELPKKPRN